MPRDSQFSLSSASSSPSMNDVAVSQAASEWVVRCDRGLTSGESRAFENWRAADPRHVAELRRLNHAWKNFDELAVVSELKTMANDVATRAQTRRSFRRTWWTWPVAGAAAAAIAIGVLTWRQRSPESVVSLHTESENYRVLASTLQRTTLTDGSVAELNGASRIEVQFTANERRVRLLEGEAHFVVAPNPDRPFFVTAGSVTVRAVGTAFNVRLAVESIEVLVTEGRVKLETSEETSPTVAVAATNSMPGSASTPAFSITALEDARSETSPALTKGQRAVISRSVAARNLTNLDVAIGDVGQAEMDDVLGWQSTRLAFNNTPLHEVVDGFNRYNRHRLTIADPAIRNRTLTGVFRADNLEGFLRLLQHTIDVKAENRTATETVLLPKR